MEPERGLREAVAPGRPCPSGSAALEALFQNAPRRPGTGLVRKPIAAVLTCVDERVVPEAIFGQKPGSLYTVRLAGNIVIPEVISSIEIALNFGCPLVIVLGHTDCGAVRLEREGHCGHFTITQHIRWATRSIPFQASLDDAILANVRHSMAELRSRLRVPVGGAVYDVVTGQMKRVEG